MTNYSPAEENYIKAIFHIQEGQEAVSTNDLAAFLSTSAASVSDMLKKLKQKKLVRYRPYYGCSLTPRGRSLALLIIRRHRLWEYFLHEKLGFLWNEVHEVAEALEHVGSEALINKLDAFLGYPKTDPHGDPIPSHDGSMETCTHRSLTQLTPLRTAVVAQIKNQSPALLNLLQKKKISIGCRIQVLQQFDFDGSMEVKIAAQSVHLTREVAENILIKIS